MVMNLVPLHSEPLIWRERERERERGGRERGGERGEEREREGGSSSSKVKQQSRGGSLGTRLCYMYQFHSPVLRTRTLPLSVTLGLKSACSGAMN